MKPLELKPYAAKFDKFDVTSSGWLDRVKSTRSAADDRFVDGKNPPNSR